VQYYRAVAAVDRGDRTTGLDAMAQMIRLGFPAGLIRSGPEFAAVLQDPDFRRLVGTAEQSKQVAQGGK
jgi:hypothetical protein